MSPRASLTAWNGSRSPGSALAVAESVPSSATGPIHGGAAGAWAEAGDGDLEATGVAQRERRVEGAAAAVGGEEHRLAARAGDRLDVGTHAGARREVGVDRDERRVRAEPDVEPARRGRRDQQHAARHETGGAQRVAPLEAGGRVSVHVRDSAPSRGSFATGPTGSRGTVRRSWTPSGSSRG